MDGLPLLSLRDLVVEIPTRRGALRVVDGVSLDVAPGEILGLVGESGAGKSKIAAAILGLLDPPGRVVGGGVYLGGQRLDTLRGEQWRRVRGCQIGAVFQDPLTSLNPLTTIGRHLTETIRAHLPLTRQQARARAVDLLEAVGLPSPAERLDAYPHQMSGGMRQRVVIALALCAAPRLIIADEPTTALDVSLQAQIMALLKRLCREHGTAVMLITHDMGVIAETADQVAVMYAGRIVETGPVDAVGSQARHPYTEGLMACIPSMWGRPARLPQIDGAMPPPEAVPTGCAFHPRCSLAEARCVSVRPPMVGRGGRAVACWVRAPDGRSPGDRLPEDGS